MNLDLHVHSIFSDDCRQPMEGHCERALELGLDGLCFTEHQDFDPNTLIPGYYNPEAYFEELYRLREKYAGRLTILAGLEFSEPHVYQKELEHAQKLPYDFILGSVHYWMGSLFPSQMRDMKMDPLLCYKRYWEQMLQMVRHGGIDGVAHLDFPKRYFRRLDYDPAMMDEIFAAMLKNNLVLEINTSSLRVPGIDETLPGKALLQRYIAQGGRHATLGSDAHEAQFLYADIEKAQALAEGLGLEIVRFVGRKMVLA